MREAQHLMLKSLRIRAGTDESYERTDVGESRLVPEYCIEQASCSPLGMSDGIVPGFANGRERVKRIGSCGVHDQIVTFYPLVKLAGCVRVTRCITDRQIGQIGRYNPATSARCDLVLAIQQSAYDGISEMPGCAYDQGLGS